jgi:hypothetical protein
MSTLIIRKKSLKTWLHTDSILGDFIISKFYFNADNGNFQVVEQGQSKRVIYDVTDITLYDDTDGGVAETFANITALSLRLEELNYPAFQYDGQIVSIANLIEAGTNVTITGDGTEASPYVISSSGGGGGAVTSVNSDTGAVIVDLPSVLAQGNRTIYEADATYTTQAIDKGRFIFVLTIGVTIFIDGDNYEIGDELEIYNEKPSENLQIVLNSPANFAQGNSDFELEPFCKAIIKKIDTNFWYYNIIRVQNPTTPSLKEVLAVEGRMIFEVSSDYTFESSNKSETIIINTASAVDLFLEDGTFLMGDEVEIYNKLSTNARIRVTGIQATQIFYKDEIIDADMLNTVTLPLYSKSWLKCISIFPTIIFELVIIEQNDAITIDATPTDGSSNAVSSNGVFDAVFTTATTGAVISFATPQIYNSIASPSTSNITDDLTGAKIGIVQKIYHNHSVAPTFPAGWVKRGDGEYVVSVLNTIYAEWSVGTTVEYWIVQ